VSLWSSGEEALPSQGSRKVVGAGARGGRHGCWGQGREAWVLGSGQGSSGFWGQGRGVRELSPVRVGQDREEAGRVRWAPGKHQQPIWKEFLTYEFLETDNCSSRTCAKEVC
jgi:hypothetical protein